MRYLVNSRQMKQADQYTIQERGIPSMELMERAARRCVETMEERGLNLSKPCIVCGSGNNGGDGFAIARLLGEKGQSVTVCFVGNESHCTEETKEQIRLLEQTGASICNEYKPDEYSIIVDAIFGVGLSREIAGEYCQTIKMMNEAKAVKFAVDMPSGISADSGSVLGIAFQADITVTFQMEKLGLHLYPGKEYAGEVVVADIGILTDVAARDTKTAYTCERKEYQRMLPLRRADSHKGTYGRLLIIAGSKGMAGAAYLNAMAAYASGAGLVQIYTREENRVILQQLLPEAIVTTYEHYNEQELFRLLKWADAVCIGSGIGTQKSAQKLLRGTLEHVKVPCVVDADGLNMIAKHRKYLRKMSGGNFVVTPHMKEMSRLTGLNVQAIRAKRMKILKKFTDEYGVVCILKDARTVVSTPRENPYVNLSGNAAMAKAGAGDVLAGIVAGLLAQGLSLRDSAVLGTYLHGRSGDRARDERGKYSVLARDLMENLSHVWKELVEESL